MKIRQTIAASAIALVSLLAAGSAGAAEYVVAGTSDPFLAGATSGSFITFNTGDVDTAADESPVGIAVTPGSTITFSDVTGTVSNGPCCAFVGPTGGADTSSNPFTVSGFTEVVAPFTNLPINSLVGVFYDPNAADPGVDSVFEIGNGGTFVVPTTVSELYLGTVDAYQWNNNLGSFSVDLSSAVPEPATWAMFLLGFGAIGWTLRGRREAKAVTA